MRNSLKTCQCGICSLFSLFTTFSSSFSTGRICSIVTCSDSDNVITIHFTYFLKKQFLFLLSGMVVHTCNLSTEKVETGLLASGHRHTQTHCSQSLKLKPLAPDVTFPFSLLILVFVFKTGSHCVSWSGLSLWSYLLQHSAGWASIVTHLFSLIKRCDSPWYIHSVL